MDDVEAEAAMVAQQLQQGANRCVHRVHLHCGPRNELHKYADACTQAMSMHNHLQHTQSHTQHTSHIYNTHRATPSTYHTFTQPKADQSSAQQGSINYAHTYIKTMVVSASSFKYLYTIFQIDQARAKCILLQQK